MREAAWVPGEEVPRLSSQTFQVESIASLPEFNVQGLSLKGIKFWEEMGKKSAFFVHSLTASLWTCIACRNRTLWFQSYLQQLSLVTYSLENKLAAESDWESDYLKSSIPWLKVWNLQDWIGTGVMRFLLITQRWNQCAKEMAWK